MFKRAFIRLLWWSHARCKPELETRQPFYDKQAGRIQGETSLKFFRLINISHSGNAPDADIVVRTLRGNVIFV